MSLLNKVIREAATKQLIEDAAAGAVSAGDVAGFRAPLGAKPTRSTKLRRRPTNGPYAEEEEKGEDWNKEVDKFRKRAKKDKGGSARRGKLRRRNRGATNTVFSLKFESIQDQKFDSADVISKLKSAENKADHADDTRGFALEDEEGRIVKVFVAAEEADDFEAALGVALAGEESEDAINDEESNSLEIAEVLFNLKDRFTIVDVEWPEVEEDEEQEVEGEDAEGELSDELDPEGGEGEDAGMEAELQGEEGMDDMEGMEGEPTGDDTMGTLQSIIDLLKSQADAQKAEANAKEAEANAEEAKYNASAAEAKVKKEEEVLDMEAYYDEQGKLDKEAKQLQKLAKWKHETAQDAEKELGDDNGADEADFDVSVDKEVDVDVSGPEENEENNVFKSPIDKNKNHKLEPGEFIKYMFKSIQRN